jgi:hypothetical protein
MGCIRTLAESGLALGVAAAAVVPATGCGVSQVSVNGEMPGIGGLAFEYKGGGDTAYARVPSDTPPTVVETALRTEVGRQVRQWRIGMGGGDQVPEDVGFDKTGASIQLSFRGDGMPDLDAYNGRSNPKKVSGDVPQTEHPLVKLTVNGDRVLVACDSASTPNYARDKAGERLERAAFDQVCSAVSFQDGKRQKVYRDNCAASVEHIASAAVSVEDRGARACVAGVTRVQNAGGALKPEEDIIAKTHRCLDASQAAVMACMASEGERAPRGTSIQSVITAAETCATDRLQGDCTAERNAWVNELRKRANRR